VKNRKVTVKPEGRSISHSKALSGKDASGVHINKTKEKCQAKLYVNDIKAIDIRVKKMQLSGTRGQNASNREVQGGRI
jgi:hypothetical protein